MNVSKGTIARLIILMLGLFNHFMVILGKPILPIEDEVIQNMIAFSWDFIASAWGYWKNNSWTKEAILADSVLKDYKKKDPAADLDGE